MSESDLERAFAFHLQATCALLNVVIPEPQREYRFSQQRRWRADFAWPEQKVIVELDGGVWTKGRHTRGAGYVNDCHKLNTATALGYRVFRLASGMLDDDPVEVLAPIIRMVAKSAEPPTRTIIKGKKKGKSNGN